LTNDWTKSLPPWPNAKTPIIGAYQESILVTKHNLVSGIGLIRVPLCVGILVERNRVKYASCST